MAGDATHGLAFEDVEVHLLMVGGGRDGPGALRVPEHQVGIGAHAQGALAREQVEDLRGIGGGQRDKILHRQFPAVHPFIPEHSHAVFDAGGAVGNAAEVVASDGFLLGTEAAVVGGGGVQVARLQAAPERFLVAVLAWAEGWTHHIAGCGLPVGMAVDTVVQQQVPGQYLAVHRLAFGAGIADFIERFAGGHMHQVHRRAQGFGNADGAAGRLALHLRRARQRMRLGPGNALGQQLALQVIDQLAVLGMHGGHRAQFQAALEAGDQGVVGGHDRVLVGHEVLEAVDTVLAHQFAHLLAHLFAPPGNGYVKAVVGGRLFRPAAPLVKGFEQRLLRVGDHKVDDRGGAAGKPCGSAAEKVFAGDRTHEGQLHVGVGVDAAWHQVLAAAIEHLATAGNVEVGADGLDHSVGTEHVGAITFLMGNQGGATNQKRHQMLLAGLTGCCRF
ncbi:hypothetical protein D3C77_379940 [compost metagenome]